MAVLSLWRALLFAASLACLVLADDIYPNRDAYCVLGCQVAFSKQTFAGTKEIANAQRCNNALYINSTYLCAKKHCKSSELASGVWFISRVCQDAGYPALPSFDAVADVSEAQIDALPALAASQKKAVLNTTTLPDAALFAKARASATAKGENRRTNNLFSNAMYIFWGGIVGIGVLSNVALLLTRNMVEKPAQTLWSGIQQTLVLPLLIPSERLAGKGVISPNRLESLVIAAFVVLSIILCAVDYHVDDGSVYYASDTLQVWSLVARRIATMMLTNIPIIWLFAIRNNVLTIATGWSYDTFSRFHRWIARVTVLEVILHAACFTRYQFIKGGRAQYYAMFNLYWWTMGVVAVVLFSFMLVQSFVWFRKHYYDAFLVGHIIFAVALLVSIYYHTKMWHGIFSGYIWACVAIWGFDRLLRLLRVATVLLTAPNGKAVMTYDANAHVVSVDATDLFREIKPFPGSYYFIYTPTRLLGWESHPFTLVSWQDSLSTPGTSHSSSWTTTPTEKIDHTSNDVQTGPSTLPTSIASSSSSSQHYGFLIHPQRGFTARLVPTSLRPHSTRLFVEGPYGRAPPLASYANILLLMGGSGITVGISCIYNMLTETESNDKKETKNVKLVWAVRKKAMLDAVCRGYLGVAAEKCGGDGGAGVVLEVDAYITQTSTSNTVSASSPSPISQTSSAGAGNPIKIEPTPAPASAPAPAPTPSVYKSHTHRPNIPQIIETAYKSAVTSFSTSTTLSTPETDPKTSTKTNTRLAVVVCGPVPFANAARDAAVKALGAGMGVDLFVESFAW